MLEVDGTGIPGDRLLHLGSRLTRVQAPDQDAILDEVILAGGHPFVIIAVGAQPTGQTCHRR